MKKFYLYLIAALVLLVVLYKIWPLPFETFAKSIILPSSNVLVEGAKKLAAPINLLRGINNLSNKNKELELQVQALEAELAKQKNNSKECGALLGEIDKTKIFQNSTVAKVISRTPGGLSQKIIINKGSSDGIQQGAAVLSGGHFIGLIKKVEGNRSEIELIFSHNSLIPVKMEKNPEGGLLQGGLEGLTVTDIPINSKTEAGDNVITSGLGGDIPSGLIVGKVGLHLGLEGELFQKVRVTSPINPYSVEFVSVLKK